MGETGLVATTRRVDGDLDLLAVAGPTGVVFERNRSGLAGAGVALRVPAASVAEALASIAVDDEVGVPGSGPVAFGALPFRADPTSELVVPATIWGRAEDGTRWVTRIEGPGVMAPSTDLSAEWATSGLSSRRGAPGIGAETGADVGTGTGTGADAGTGAGAPDIGRGTGATTLGAAPTSVRPGIGVGSGAGTGTEPGAPDIGGGAGAATRPGRMAVSPVRSAEWWCDLVAEATEAMAAAGPDGLRKVVLAREVLVESDRPFVIGEVLARLRAAFPGCYLFHVDGFVGASPEMLVSRAGDIVRAQPMAGTAPRGGDPTTDARLAAGLLGSPTYRHEHQITIDMVHDTLLPWCSYLDYEAEPSVVGVANVQHLATMVEGRLSQPAPSVLDMVAALHPTPAVNGWPREAAQRWIAEHEGFDRRRYGGAVGWVDATGNGTWAVSIRCADIDGATARLCAGNGIVADSDPLTELHETQAKLQALLSTLIRV